MKKRMRVMIPTYNAEQTIRQRVDGVLCQTVAPHEVIPALRFDLFFLKDRFESVPRPQKPFPPQTRKAQQTGFRGCRHGSSGLRDPPWMVYCIVREATPCSKGARFTECVAPRLMKGQMDGIEKLLLGGDGGVSFGWLHKVDKSSGCGPRQ